MQNRASFNSVCDPLSRPSRMPQRQRTPTGERCALCEPKTLPCPLPCCVLPAMRTHSLSSYQAPPRRPSSVIMATSTPFYSKAHAPQRPCRSTLLLLLLALALLGCLGLASVAAAAAAADAANTTIHRANGGRTYGG